MSFLVRLLNGIPTTNLRIVFTLCLIGWTAYRFLNDGAPAGGEGWEAWLIALCALAGLDVGQYAIKRRTYLQPADGAGQTAAVPGDPTTLQDHPDPHDEGAGQPDAWEREALRDATPGSPRYVRGLIQHPDDDARPVDVVRPSAPAAPLAATEPAEVKVPRERRKRAPRPAPDAPAAPPAASEPPGLTDAELEASWEGRGDG